MKIIKGLFKILIGIFAVIGGIVSFNFVKKVAKEVEEDMKREEEEIILTKEYLEELEKEEKTLTEEGLEEVK
ncbi:MAG: hypothetical protein IJH34_17550 [Romboutsia sp.]|nr:hypothetical protein [Romboutsia sp.]